MEDRRDDDGTPPTHHTVANARVEVDGGERDRPRASSCSTLMRATPVLRCRSW